MKLTTAAILLLLAAPALGQDGTAAEPDPSETATLACCSGPPCLDGLPACPVTQPPPLTAAQRGDFFKLAYLFGQLETQKKALEDALLEMSTRLAKGLPCEIGLKNGEPVWACDAVSPEVAK